MLFFIFTFISGLCLFLLPLVGLAIFRRRFHLPRTLFWKAGFYRIVIGFLLTGVIGNLGSFFPGLLKSGRPAQALVIGLLMGLFLELGRFVVLDRWQKKVRDFRSGMWFGFGWGGVNALLIGILTIINSVGFYFLTQVSDLKAQFPDFPPEQLQLLEEAKTEALAYAQGNPLVGFSPLLENASYILIDMALTLLMIYGLSINRNFPIWQAVAIRAAVSGVIFYLLPMDFVWGEIMMVVFGASALLVIKNFSSATKIPPTSFSV